MISGGGGTTPNHPAAGLGGSLAAAPPRGNNAASSLAPISPTPTASSICSPARSCSRRSRPCRPSTAAGRFDVVDLVPHTLLALDVDPAGVKVVWPEDLTDATWMRPGIVSPVEQAFGDALLDRHPLAVVPSVVSTRSWNLLIDVPTGTGRLTMKMREPFVLDPRLSAS